MSIFWRALDWRTYLNSKEENGRQVLRVRDNWTEEYQFAPEHRNASLLARRAAALSVIYQSCEGYPAGTPRKKALIPSKVPSLGNISMVQHLRWIPSQYRIQVAHIIQFALATLATRLAFGQYSMIPIDHLKHWMVTDLRDFAGQTSARYLEKWWDEVHSRASRGEQVFKSFEVENYDMIESASTKIQFEQFSKKDEGLLFRVGCRYNETSGRYSFVDDDAPA